MANGAVGEVPIGGHEDESAAVFDEDLKVALAQGTATVQPRGWDHLNVDVRALLHLVDEGADRLAETVEVLRLDVRGCWAQPVRGWLNRKSRESGRKPLKNNLDRSALANLYRSM